MLRLLREQYESARTSLGPDIFEYFASGSGDQITTREAETAWGRWRLRPRVLRDVSTVDVGIGVVGTPAATPFLVAPTAFHALAHPAGECATVAGAGEAGALTVISTRASRTIEEIAAAATGPWWFQAYEMRDRGLTDALVKRASAAGASAIVLTVDTPYVGRKDLASSRPNQITDDHFLVNLRPHLQPGAERRDAGEQNPATTSEAIARLHDVSGLPVLAKGVLRADEALRCLDAGAAGIVVSNHGGRQLDRSIASAVVLEEVVDAVEGRAPVLVDGGIRSGADALTALILGASAVLVGRPVLWALATGGATGVTAVLRALTEDLRHIMALAGAVSVADLGRDLLYPLH